MLQIKIMLHISLVHPVEAVFRLFIFFSFVPEHCVELVRGKHIFKAISNGWSFSIHTETKNNSVNHGEYCLEM